MMRKSRRMLFIVFSFVLATGVHAQARENNQGNAAYDAGKFELALEKYQKAEGIPDNSNAYLTQSWIEYGRFLVANNRPAGAVPYFSKAVPTLEALGIETSDPIAYAQFGKYARFTAPCTGRTAINGATS
jgi:tetratricopeptide (TPR) repeat protein